MFPADATLLPVSELSERLRTRIGPVDEGQSIVTRPGYRITTRLVPAPLAALIEQFRVPSLLTDAVLRFALEHGQDPLAVLDLSFDAMATLVEARILVPEDSADVTAPIPSLGAGQDFAGFEIEALVRSLEDSEVYRATGRDGGHVAVKIARDDRPAIVAALANETWALERLAGVDSPLLLGNGTDRGRSYVAMEWCEGVSIAVAAQQARAARDRPRLRSLVARMLHAYGRLHARGVLHGDIHPGNCLVRDDGTVVILDFGAARPVDEGRPADLTRAGIPQFYDPSMAAAMLAGGLPPAATPRSEQYALGVLAYLLLTGLFPVDSPAVQDELLRCIIERSPLPFAARGVAAWPDIEAVLRRAMAEQPDERFPDVAGLADALATARMAPLGPRRWPGHARDAFNSAVDDVRCLRPADGFTLANTWFALRAAIALEDAELLAAADVMARGLGAGWAGCAVAAQVARARSDRGWEGAAIAGFLASAAPLPDGPEMVAAILAAAVILEGGRFRTREAAPLAQWAGECLSRMLAAPSSNPTGSTGSVSESMVFQAALALVQSGVLAVPSDLPSRLAAMDTTPVGGVWFWALANDVLAGDRFLGLALTAARPDTTLEHGLALLRLHQITGELRWVDEAGRVLAAASSARSPRLDTALLMAELMIPEQVRPLPAGWPPAGRAVPGAP